MSKRLAGWDYAAGGGYFVTVCTHRRRPVLGVVDGVVVHRTALGELAAGRIAAILERRDAVQLDACVLMPDHVHLIVILLPTSAARRSLEHLVAEFKASTTYAARQEGKSTGASRYGSADSTIA